MARREAAVALGFALFGAVWAAMALRLPYMGAVAPGSGFLPFWLGLTLMALSLALLLRLWRSRGAVPEAPSAPFGWRKPALVAAGLFLCIGAIPWLGFLLAVGCYLVVLMRWIEARPWIPSLAVGLGTPMLLVVLFRLWLGVPLPRNVFGF